MQRFEFSGIFLNPILSGWFQKSEVLFPKTYVGEPLLSRWPGREF